MFISLPSAGLWYLFDDHFCVVVVFFPLLLYQLKIKLIISNSLYFLYALQTSRYLTATPSSFSLCHSYVQYLRVNFDCLLFLFFNIMSGYSLGTMNAFFQMSVLSGLHFLFLLSPLCPKSVLPTNSLQREIWVPEKQHDIPHP